MARTRMPLVLRLTIIIVLFLVLPTIGTTIFVNMKAQEAYWMRVEETIDLGRYSFVANLSLQQQEMEARAVSLSNDADIIVMFEGLANKVSGETIDPGTLALSRQTDIGFTWFDLDRSHTISIGRGGLDADTLATLARDLGPRGPASKILVDQRGLNIVTVTPLRKVEQVVGWLVLHRRSDRSSLETLRLSIGQELSIIDQATGMQLFTTFSNAYGEPVGNGRLRPELTGPEAASTAIVVEREVSGRSYFTMAFPLFGPATTGLVAEIAIPSDKLLSVDTVQNYATITISTILLVLLTGLLLTRSVISPILGLSYAVDSLRRHVRDHVPPIMITVKNNDEIGDLARSVNELGAALRESTEKIQEQRAEIIAYTHTLEQRVQERTRELEEARRRAEMANEHKSRFLVNMNHELRTPLNSIQGITDLLRFGAYEKHEELAPLLQEIRESEPISKDPFAANLIEQAAEHLALDGNGKRFLLRWVKMRLLEDAGGLDAELPSDLSTRFDHAASLIDDEERQIFKAYNNIRDAGESLLSIIDEVINLSRIESGVITITKQRVKVADLLTSCMIHAESYARSKRKLQNLEFSRALENEVPETAILDGQKIKQVLLNLLTNAVKYTEHGYIHCRIGVKVEEGIQLLVFSVQDTGRGIAEKDRELLFLEFGRVFEVREIEGTGLGLALSRKLIERHGGTMDFTSEPGKGSTFWFTVPISEEELS